MSLWEVTFWLMLLLWWSVRGFDSRNLNFRQVPRFSQILIGAELGLLGSNSLPPLDLKKKVSLEDTR